jgi:site-specific DNA-methyltransferase (adenine-specific)
MIDLRCGDALALLREMEGGSVDAIVTDPPYGVKYATWDSALPPQEVLSEMLRVCRGPVLWFTASKVLLEFASYDPRPDRILCWAPAFALTHTAKSGIFYRFHPIVVWRCDKATELPFDVLRDNTEGRNWWNHPATKPIALMRRLVGAFSAEGDTVLDPFAGSGSTGVACVSLGRNFIGFDLNSEYVEIARRRIAADCPLFNEDANV